MIQTVKHQALAMISVPWQEYVTPMAPADALLYGTVFSNLAQTYTPVSGIENSNCMQNMHSMQMTQNVTHANTMNAMQMPNMNMQKKR